MVTLGESLPASRLRPAVRPMRALALAGAIVTGCAALLAVSCADTPEFVDSRLATQLAETPPPSANGGARRGVSSSLFEDVSNAAQVSFPQYRQSFDFMPFGGGVVVLDYNGDGQDDIYVAAADDPFKPGLEISNALYRNNGDGTFSNVARIAGVDDPAGRGNGGCAADYDNDGNHDLFVANWGTSRLFRNTGDGTFDDVTGEAGVGDPDLSFRTMGCAWGDYDRDGFLDLVVVRHMSEADLMASNMKASPGALRPIALYRSDGNGGFINVASLLGDASGPEEGKPFGSLWGAGFQPGWTDYDSDGDPDLYVVNDFGADIQPNILWRNDGPGRDGSWVFTDISSDSGTDAAIFGMGLAVGDYNLDGHLDFYLTNIGEAVLLANDGNGQTFTQAAAGAGTAAIEGQQRVTWGNVFFDYDNDGDEDLYVVSGYLDIDQDNPTEQPNVLLTNERNGGFTDSSAGSGADDPGVGRGVAYLDFNGDGCLDLYVVNLGVSASLPQQARLFQNACATDNSWLIVKTVGSASNRDGIGARIKVAVGGQTQIREVAAGGSSMSQNMIPVHFGLGPVRIVDSIEIIWPSGVVQTLTDVAANQRLTATEPQ